MSPPRKRLPVSPMKMAAGKRLKIRKPPTAPAPAAATAASSPCPLAESRTASTRSTCSAVPAARPSMPSCRFKALVVAASRKADSKRKPPTWRFAVTGAFEARPAAPESITAVGAWLAPVPCHSRSAASTSPSAVSSTRRSRAEMPAFSRRLILARSSAAPIAPARMAIATTVAASRLRPGTQASHSAEAGHGAGTAHGGGLRLHRVAGRSFLPDELPDLPTLEPADAGRQEEDGQRKSNEKENRQVDGGQVG